MGFLRRLLETQHQHHFRVRYWKAVWEKAPDDPHDKWTKATNRYFILEQCSCGEERAWSLEPFKRTPVEPEWLRIAVLDRTKVDIPRAGEKDEGESQASTTPAENFGVEPHDGAA